MLWLKVHAHDNRGFTLMEMLVAAAIFAVVMSAAWGAFGQLLNNSSAHRRRLAQTHAISNLYLNLVKDMTAVRRQLKPSANQSQAYTYRPAFHLHSVSDKECSATLTLETHAYLYPYRALTDQALRVTYFVGKTQDSEQALKRSVSLLHEKKTTPAHLMPVIVPQVTCWTVSVLDDQGRTHRRWPLEGQPPTQSAARPEYLQIEILTPESPEPVGMEISF